MSDQLQQQLRTLEQLDGIKLDYGACEGQLTQSFKEYTANQLALLRMNKEVAENMDWTDAEDGEKETALKNIDDAIEAVIFALQKSIYAITHI